MQRPFFFLAVPFLHLLVLFVCCCAAVAANPEQIWGLAYPTSFIEDDQGHILVAEKQGRVRSFLAADGTTLGAVLVDVSARAATYGDLGLLSIAFAPGYIYTLYNVFLASSGNVCLFPDSAIGSIPDAAVAGCPASGVLSRWPYDSGGAGRVMGPEQVVMDGWTRNAAGTSHYMDQFTSHGVGSVLVAPDGGILTSWGDGATFAAPDVGQFGSNPGGDVAPYLGAYRAQNPDVWNGKVVRLDPVSLQWRVAAIGLRNPFRMTLSTTQGGAPGALLGIGNTGWYQYESLYWMTTPSGAAAAEAGPTNFGWPCYEGD